MLIINGEVIEGKNVKIEEIEDCEGTKATIYWEEE